MKDNKRNEKILHLAKLLVPPQRKTLKALLTNSHRRLHVFRLFRGLILDKLGRGACRASFLWNWIHAESDARRGIRTQKLANETFENRGERTLAHEIFERRCLVKATTNICRQKRQQHGQQTQLIDQLSALKSILRFDPATGLCLLRDVSEPRWRMTVLLWDYFFSVIETIRPWQEFRVIRQ